MNQILLQYHKEYNYSDIIGEYKTWWDRFSSKNQNLSTLLLNQMLITCIIGFLIGIPTNLTIILLVRRIRKLHTTAKIFVSNLALVNVLVLILMVLGVVFVFTCFHWKMAYISPSLLMFTHIEKMVSVTMLIMERAVALMFSCKTQNISDKKANKIDASFLLDITIYFHDHEFLLKIVL